MEEGREVSCQNAGRPGVGGGDDMEEDGGEYYLMGGKGRGCRDPPARRQEGDEKEVWGLG